MAKKILFVAIVSMFFVALIGDAYALVDVSYSPDAKYIRYSYNDGNTNKLAVYKRCSDSYCKQRNNYYYYKAYYPKYRASRYYDSSMVYNRGFRQGYRVGYDNGYYDGKYDYKYNPSY